MKEFLWKCFAWLVSREAIANYLIKRSKATPYFHLDSYMRRWWLFNGYPPEREKEKKYKWLPSIRIHHILREDRGRDLHNHPWDARTIILKGWYIERRLEQFHHDNPEWPDSDWVKYNRTSGNTATINADDFHSIDEVSPNGVWTMFITYAYQGTWGFLKDGKFIKHTEYEGVP